MFLNLRIWFDFYFFSSSSAQFFMINWIWGREGMQRVLHGWKRWAGVEFKHAMLRKNYLIFQDLEDWSSFGSSFFEFESEKTVNWWFQKSYAIRTTPHPINFELPPAQSNHATPQTQAKTNKQRNESLVPRQSSFLFILPTSFHYSFDSAALFD